ncbi:MAG: hypothetical protein ABIJ31_16720 [Pseudomonadota bacterium]
MKKITIGNFETTEMKTFGYVYLSSFGALWLLIEPLGAFGIAPKYLSNLGLISADPSWRNGRSSCPKILHPKQILSNKQSKDACVIL